MPDTTPIFSFPYPCPDEVVGPLAFQQLANAIDAKLMELAADETAALNRPNARRQSAVNTATNGVLTVTTGANSSFVIPAAGVWLVSAFVPAIGGAGVANDYKLGVRQNTVTRFAVSKNLFFFIQAPVANCLGPMVCAVGDTIDTNFFYTGTLTITYSVILDLRLIVRIP